MIFFPLRELEINNVPAMAQLFLENKFLKNQCIASLRTYFFRNLGSKRTSQSGYIIIFQFPKPKILFHYFHFKTL